MSNFKKKSGGGGGAMFVCLSLIVGVLAVMGGMNAAALGAGLAVLLIYSESVFSELGDVSFSDPESLGEALEALGAYGPSLVNTFVVWFVTLEILLFVVIVYALWRMRRGH